MQFLFICGVSERVGSLPFKIWRDHITNMIHTAAFEWSRDNLVIFHGIRSKLDHFEDELPQLKEVTTILELALWKMKMNEKKSHQDIATQSQKKMKSDESSIRQQCRVTCGPDVVLCHVLQF
jgi:Co/Zn/Cd efflux system component